MRVKLGMAVAGLVSISGCAIGNVDETEQPMFSMRGRVAATAVAISNQLVPALTFSPYMADWGHTDFIVMGEHQGRLLEDFELDVYEPPPPEAAIELTQGQPAIALGGIAVVSPEHPSRLDWDRDADGNMQVCADMSDCGALQQDPCGSLHTARCLGTLVEGKNWGLHGIASQYMVMYLDEPAHAGSVYSQFFAQGEPIPAGYSLIRLQRVIHTLSKSEQDAYYACHERALNTALAQFNTSHGTNFTDHHAISMSVNERDNAKLLSDWDGAMIEAFVIEGCILPGAQQLARDHGEMQPLDLTVLASNGQ